MSSPHGLLFLLRQSDLSRPEPYNELISLLSQQGLGGVFKTSEKRQRPVETVGEKRWNFVKLVPKSNPEISGLLEFVDDRGGFTDLDECIGQIHYFDECIGQMS